MPTCICQSGVDTGLVAHRWLVRVRCHTRYCDATCQHDHWRRGHKQICKKIHRGGNAEQYNADKKYKEAVAVAVEKCADDTKGQKCYICLETVHRRTGEGLVRGCACHTSEGFVHVSCLVERSKFLVDEAEGGKSAIDMFKDSKNQADTWDCWRFCNLCGHEYHGVVKLAYAWGCWKTYLGRSEFDGSRMGAITELSNGFAALRRHDKALALREINADTIKRAKAMGGIITQRSLMITYGGLANAYDQLNRADEALVIRREMYDMEMKLNSKSVETFQSAQNLGISLLRLDKFKEARAFLHANVTAATDAHGPNAEITLRLRWGYASVLLHDDPSSEEDTREAVRVLEDVVRRVTQGYGEAHPLRKWTGETLVGAQKHLALIEASK